jgi:predicted DNA-binding transcriptional regulator AlpA
MLKLAITFHNARGDVVINEEAKLLPKRSVKARYGGVSDMTIHRWINGKSGFPHPVLINRRCYWRSADLDAFDASLKHGKAAAPGKAA